MTWRLHLLGQPRLQSSDGGRQHTLPVKDAALLAVVALEGPIAGERLAALLWPQATARQAETSLRQRLFRLRRHTQATLVVSGTQLRLAPDVDTDLAPALRALAGDTQAAPVELLGDLAVDDELPELAAWLHVQRRQWQARCQGVLAAAAEQHEKTGALARALVYAKRLAEADALAEHAQRRLMRLHYLRGDRAAAIAVFEHFERRLKDELGTRPSAETIELMATIERSAAQLPAHRAVVPVSLIRPPQLVGREPELAALARCWAAGRVFVVSGEAGVGKSRLLQTWVDARDGVIGMQARPGDADVAYALLARLLRALHARHPPATDQVPALALLLPELGAAPAVTGEAQRAVVHRAVEAGLQAAMAAGLVGLVVDDLHFADAASLDALQALVDAPPLRALCWGLAQRPAATAVASPLQRLLEEAGRLEPLPLGPLDGAQLTALIASLAVPGLDPARLAPALLRHAGGNPMFSLETLKEMLLADGGRAWAAGERLPQPASVAALVARRLTQLTEPALRLARTAALAGPAFDAELAAAVLAQHPLDLAGPWQELEAAQVIREGEFAHDLIFEAVRASVPEPIARWAHHRIAQHLQQRGAAPEVLAPHWAGAGQWAQAGAAHAAAARRARAASQRHHEAQSWRLAAEAHERAGALPQAFAARCESIDALIVVHGVTHAQAVIDALLAAAQTDGERVAALTARAKAALMAADHATGVAAAAQALALCPGLDSPWPGFEAARLHAVGLAQAGQPQRALAVIEPLRALIDTAADTTTDATADTERRSRFWSDYAYVLNGARRLRDTAGALEQAIAGTQALGDLAEQATLTVNLATVRGNLGQADAALALARQALALQDRLGATDGPEGAVVQTYAGLYSAMAGRYGEALAHLDAALAGFERDHQPVWRAVAANHQAQCLIDLGQYARAQQALAYPPPPLDHVQARGATIAARLARMQSQSTQAGQHLARALALLGPGADPQVRLHAWLEAAVQAPPDQAVAHCDAVVAEAGALECAALEMKAHLLRADALRRAGHADMAAAALRARVPLLSSLQPADLPLGQAWWLVAQVFEAAGDEAAASQALAQGVHWLHQVALPHVPPAFTASFMQRVPSHGALLAAAQRRQVG